MDRRARRSQIRNRLRRDGAGALRSVDAKQRIVFICDPAYVFKRHYRVYEVPITYDGRGYEEGKKITWRDGFVALWVLLKYRFGE